MTWTHKRPAGTPDHNIRDEHGRWVATARADVAPLLTAAPEMRDILERLVFCADEAAFHIAKEEARNLLAASRGAE